jgi:ADP-heptose:LPS heptosyltransferase
MGLIKNIMSAQRRRRTVSSLDAPYREVLRRIERRIKFLLSDPMGLLLNPRRAKLPIPASQIKSILILRYDALGDVILTTPLWRILKKHAPHIRVGVAGSTRNELLLKSDPDIDDVFVISRAISPSVVKELFRARRQKWDIVLNLFFHDKTRAAVFAKIMSKDGISVTMVREKKEKYEQIYSFVGDRPALPAPMVMQNLKVLLDAVEIGFSDEEKLPSLKIDPDFDKAFRIASKPLTWQNKLCAHKHRCLPKL